MWSKHVYLLSLKKNTFLVVRYFKFLGFQLGIIVSFFGFKIMLFDLHVLQL